MKKIFKSLILLFLFFIPFNIVSAENTNDSSTIIKEEDKEYYNHSYFEAGNELNVNKLVDGISFIAGNIVKFNGETTYGAVAGENVVINSKIEKDLFAAGNMVSIEKEANIGRDVYLAGNEVKISSDINGDAYLAASTVILDNITINGDVNVTSGNFEIKDNVVINGTLNINEDAKFVNESNLKVQNKKTYKSVDVKVERNILLEILFALLSIVFTGVLLAVIFPKTFGKVDDEVSASKVCKYALFGFVGLIAIPIASIVLIGTIVGVVVGIALLLAYVIMLLFASSFAAYSIGKCIFTKLFKQNDNIYLDIIVGGVFLKLISYIPYIGGLLSFIIFIYGLGLIINVFMNRNKK